MKKILEKEITIYLFFEYKVINPRGKEKKLKLK